MQRLSMAGWILTAALATGMLPGCAEVVAQQAAGEGPAGAAGTRPPAPAGRTNARTDWRAYYA
ncbi:MAG TPA: hypothetical protein VF464_07075, partial [Candidatus Methylomirabilis sp.]